MKFAVVRTLLILLVFSGCANSIHSKFGNSNEVKINSASQTFYYLKSSPTIKFKVQDEWKIFIDNKNNKIWSFSPENHPAYPSVVVRRVIKRGSGLYIDTKITCEGSQLACDELAEHFKTTDQHIIISI